MDDKLLYPIMKDPNTYKYVNMVSRWLCGKFGCYWLLEDIKQDFYVAIMEISKKKPGKSYRYILYEAKYDIYDIYDILSGKKYKERWGRTGHRYRREVDILDQWALADKSIPTEAEVCDKATLDGIPQLVSKRQADALQRNKVEGWSLKEIAKRYNVGDCMISKDMTAAIKKLQKKWGIRDATRLD